MYVDQDKGWTLLNRGTVIGKIKFSIEELLAGLNGIDIDDFDRKENHTRTKQRQIFGNAEYTRIE